MSVWLFDKYIKSTGLYFMGIYSIVKNHYIISNYYPYNTSIRTLMIELIIYNKSIGYM